MPKRLDELLSPATTVVLTQECQNGVIGSDSPFPDLVEAVEKAQLIPTVASLVEGARAAGVTVIHAVAARRPDGKGASVNARLFKAAANAPKKQLLGTSAVEVVSPIGCAPGDLVSTRLHGLSPIAGTDVDALLRNLGARTVVIVGVSTNVAIPNAVFDAVNLGYQVVLPRDGIAGASAAYTDELIANTLSLIATITNVSDVLAAWGK